MKKIVLTMAVAFSTLIASAQFMAVTTIDQPADSAEWGVNSFTDNLGLGYAVNDHVTLGMVKNGEDYDLFGRYHTHGNIYFSAQASTEELLDNLIVGIGYSVILWGNLNVEPNYTMRLEEDSEGEFNIGLSYRF